MLEVSQVEECKRLFAQGVAIREIAEKLDIARNTVRGYLRGERLPGEYRQQTARQKPVRQEIEARVRSLLVEEKERETPRKQRLTTRRVHRILLKEGYRPSYSTVRRLIVDLRLELRDALAHAFLTLQYEPGVDAQVDFFEGVVDRPDGTRDKVYILLVRACFSGRTFAYPAPNQTRESLFEGLVQAFEYFGGVFQTLWFDNLTPAVKKVLQGRTRELQEEFKTFAAYYGFKAEFCGPAKGNEKGGVENEVKYCRGEILSPIPDAEDRQALLRLCNTWMKEDDARTPEGRDRTIGEMWKEEVAALIELPPCRFEIGAVRTSHVTPRSWVSIETNRYSVPVEWVGREVAVRVGAEEITISSRFADRVVCHARCYGRGELVLELDHYLPLLERKHRGLDRARVMKEWLREQDPCWKELLRVLRAKDGESGGGKAFLDVLFLTRTEDVEKLTDAVRAALLHPDVSLATIRFQLSGEAEQIARGEGLDDYAGPASSCGCVDDYMVLVESKETPHG